MMMILTEAMREEMMKIQEIMMMSLVVEVAATKIHQFHSHNLLGANKNSELPINNSCLGNRYFVKCITIRYYGLLILTIDYK